MNLRLAFSSAVPPVHIITPCECIDLRMVSCYFSDTSHHSLQGATVKVMQSVMQQLNVSSRKDSVPTMQILAKPGHGWVSHYEGSIQSPQDTAPSLGGSSRA